MKTFFTYYGGKYLAAPIYPKPQYDTIIEPFAGSAGYAVRYPSYNIILVEKNPVIAALWRYLIRVSPEEILALPDIEDGQTVDDYDCIPEAKSLIGFWLNKGSAMPCKRPSKWMRTGSRSGYWGGEIRQRIAGQVGRIRHWTVIEGDYSDAPDIPATWFIDPPYIGAGKHYKCSSTAIDYESLARWCRTRPGQVIVCENDGATWLPFTPFCHIRSTPGKPGTGYSAESIWYQTDKVEPSVFD